MMFDNDPVPFSILPERTSAEDGMALPQLHVLLASPRGFCAGVRRAIEAVRDALRIHGAPVYVRRPIVHNMIVVRELEAQGAVFVEELDSVPRGAVVILSAHGVPPSVALEARRRGLVAYDAVCPLVAKVHREVERHHKEGRHVVLAGHSGHPEIVGTLGHLPEGAATLVATAADVAALPFPPETPIGLAVQTTYSVDEAADVADALTRRFPDVAQPSSADICYATTNRQAAVKQLAPLCDLVLVIGSSNSSNSKRLVEVARDYGTEAHLIDTELEVDEAWLDGKTVVGVSSGASAPEELVERLVAFFRDRGVVDVSEFSVIREDVRFMLPKTIRPDRH
jgi:4-hydroxy-3-methylbut-2-enyl diphosphate reductase